MRQEECMESTKGRALLHRPQVGYWCLRQGDQMKLILPSDLIVVQRLGALKPPHKSTWNIGEHVISGIPMFMTSMRGYKHIQIPICSICCSCNH